MVTKQVTLSPGPVARLRSPQFVRSGKTAVGGAVAQVGEMAVLLWEVLHSAVTRPTGYWGNVRTVSFDILRMNAIPIFVALPVFGMDAPGVVGGGLFNLFGMPERLGSFFMMASVREFAPFINMMIIAGVTGTAITADLGARRIREEFDAMEVLGVDPVREIILPRIIALTIMTGLYDVISLTLGVMGGVLAELQLKANVSGFFASFWANATTTEMWTSVVKSSLYGLLIGIICCYKGYRASGGPAGVGRAVNQAVVISFAFIWNVHFLFTSVMLGLNPDMMVYR